MAGFIGENNKNAKESYRLLILSSTLLCCLVIISVATGCRGRKREIWLLRKLMRVY